MKLFNDLNSPNNETTFFGIDDLMYCEMVKKYGCGILSKTAEDTIAPQLKIISYYADGCKLYSFLTNNPPELVSNLYGILMWNQVKFKFGQEPFEIDDLKYIIFNDSSREWGKKAIKRFNELITE